MDDQQCVGGGTIEIGESHIKPKQDGMRLRTERNIRVNQALLAEREVRLGADGATLPSAAKLAPPVWTTCIRAKHSEHYKQI